MVTVHHAYSLLESDGVIRARPRSGFYLQRAPRPMHEFAPFSDEVLAEDRSPSAIADLTFSIMSSWTKPGLETFGSVLPSADLFPEGDLKYFLRKELRHKVMRMRVPSPPEGEASLREFISKRLVERGLHVGTEGIVLTQGGAHALNLCIETVTQPGDLVLVESPSFFPMLAALQRRNLRAVEIYSHPKNGIDPDQFAYLMDSNPVSACLLMATHHYPTGITYSDDAMRRVVAKAAETLSQYLSARSYDRQMRRTRELLTSRMQGDWRLFRNIFQRTALFRGRVAASCAGSAVPRLSTLSQQRAWRCDMVLQ